MVDDADSHSSFFFFLAELIIIQIEHSILHQDLQFEIKELRKMCLFYTC